MNSLDTNILLYATNADCDEHAQTRRLVDWALANPKNWVMADQVYFELYRLLRNPAVLERPRSSAEAWECLDYYRHHSGWLHCAYETPFMDQVAEILRNTEFAPRKTFDLVLAVTLKRNGVTTLYTRNTADFEGLEWFTVVNPLGQNGDP